MWTESEGDFDPLPEKLRRSIKWNTEILSQLLKQIVAARKVSSDNCICREDQDRSYSRKTVLDEVTEIISLPPFSAGKREKNLNDLHTDVTDQLKDFVTAVALLYRSNPFHNFEVGVQEKCYHLVCHLIQGILTETYSFCFIYSMHPMSR